MRCPNCGYPNEEDASTCFSCDARIEGLEIQDHHKGSVGSSEPEKRTLSTWLAENAEGRWEVWSIALALMLVSAFLPWASAFYRNTDSLIIEYTVSANLFSLLNADDYLIASLAAIFIIGFLVAMLMPYLVIIPISSLVLLMYKIPDFMLSLLPATPPNPTDEFVSGYGIGIGLLLAWLSLAALGVLCLRNFELLFNRGRGKYQTPSEVDDSSINMDSRRRVL